MPTTPILMRRQSDYVRAIQQRLPDWTKKDIREFLRAQAGAAVECLSTGRRWDRAVIVPGLVKVFAAGVPAKPQRQVKNPATGKPMTLQAEPEHMKAVARVLARVKVAVNPPPIVPEGPPVVVKRDRYHREPVI